MGERHCPVQGVRAAGVLISESVVVGGVCCPLVAAQMTAVSRAELEGPGEAGTYPAFRGAGPVLGGFQIS